MWFLLIACVEPKDTGLEINDTSTTIECIPGEIEKGFITWINFCDDAFLMGSVDGEGDENEYPQHLVTIPPFKIMQSETTQEQYTKCVEEEFCSPPEGDLPERCTYNKEDFKSNPINCIDWEKAKTFCEWAGGTLPTEAQWEYAASSMGKPIDYPWGNEEPTCDLAILNEDDCCGTNNTWPVCSKPSGNTEQNLCDIAGNVFEWLEDYHHNNYNGAPTDGSAWLEPESLYKGMRGGGIGSTEGYRIRNRVFHEPDFFYSGLGVRCVKTH